VLAKSGLLGALIGLSLAITPTVSHEAPARV
jgi:hypothetical protein